MTTLGWEGWARDVAGIAAAHVTRIRGLLAQTRSAPARQFEVFLADLRGTLNDSITADEAIDTLAQHLVTRPVFEALFDGYDLVATNPVAAAMERMLATLDEHGPSAENETLESFYAAVRRRVRGVDNAEGRQRILVELYDQFFSVAFRRVADRLGIVYTPIEIVDFILRSADAVLRREFGQGLTDEGVHILDGFAGTGTFLVRLLQSGLIRPADLARKYARELHGNEILLLAHHIAGVNIQTTYTDLTGRPEHFPGLVLTDTFQPWHRSWKPGRLPSPPITVIVGNPPYSVGQASANDNNANERYPDLDEEIRRTYADRSTATNKNSLYNSYIRAIRWASLRIGDRGVIAFVTPNGLLDGNSTDGLRKSLADEFATIHVFDLGGDQKGDWRREGGKIFGAGSQVGICVIVLVRDRTRVPPASVHYGRVGDYLGREAKLARVAAAEDILTVASTAIVPNSQGDWLNQRSDTFLAYLALGDGGIFERHGRGYETGRDVWVYGSSAAGLRDVMGRATQTYAGVLDGHATNDESLIKWTVTLRSLAKRRVPLPYDERPPVRATYRPFCPQWMYADQRWIHRPGVVASTFPTPDHHNHGFVLTGVSSHAPFSLLAVQGRPDLHVLDTGQYFARWRYEKVGGYRRIDNITDGALGRFRAAYPGEVITKDDIFFYVYGLLHSPAYREAYAADLKKMLPRIPFAADFRGFVHAGRRLSDLHLGYESATPYPLQATVGNVTSPLATLSPTGDPYAFFAVSDRKMRFARPTAEQRAAGAKQDRTTIHYNDRIVLTGIPSDAYDYPLGSRSAIEWVIDRYRVRTDRDSGIVNDPNDWSREVANPRHIIDLLARVVTVSLTTTEIIRTLPDLDILPGVVDQA